MSSSIRDSWWFPIPPPDRQTETTITRTERSFWKSLFVVFLFPFPVPTALPQCRSVLKILFWLTSLPRSWWRWRSSVIVLNWTRFFFFPPSIYGNNKTCCWDAPRTRTRLKRRERRIRWNAISVILSFAGCLKCAVPCLLPHRHPSVFSATVPLLILLPSLRFRHKKWSTQASRRPTAKKTRGDQRKEQLHTIYTLSPHSFLNNCA